MTELPVQKLALLAFGGLSSSKAAAVLAEDGPNELPRAGQRSILRIAGDVVREPMLALLLAGGIAYLLLGDLAEALILLGFATFSVAVTVIQETRTEHVLEALRDLSAPRAMVVRDGERVRIAGREVVRGDVIVLEQGDRVAADATLHDASDLQVDESLLSGESLPVTKVAQTTAALAADHRPGGDDQPYVYSGSLVARGSGMAVVTATGSRSEIGEIGLSLAMLDNASSCCPPSVGESSQDRSFCSTACFAAAGSTRCSLGSRSAWRCFQKSFWSF
jgi:Ca2+-transporting ATPase